MPKLNILHITDLHLDEITSTNENLRKAKYKEYIDDLVESINSTLKQRINFLACTGDFLNKNKVQNWQHARTILNYLVSKLKIAYSEVAICIGNHDIDLSLDAKGELAQSRKLYNEIADTFHPEETVVEDDFYKIFYSPQNRIYLLTFDSTLGCDGKNVPGKQSDDNIDRVITTIDEKVPLDRPLVVLSHYPMVLFNRSQIHLDGENWVEEHLWKSGTYLAERIYKRRKEGLTLWLFGDGHLPQFWSFSKYHHFFMTGMFGGNYIKTTFKDTSGQIKAYNKTNQAKVIECNLLDNTLVLHTYNYSTNQYENNPHLGTWDHIASEIREVDNVFEKYSAMTKNEPTFSTSAHVNPDSVTQRISSSVEEEIISQIRDRKLYTFNRYATSSTEVSLGWVSINKLFEKNELLSRCIQKMAEWISKVLGSSFDRTNTIFIGIDFWGAIFASQSSIILNIENYCIATKSRNEHNILFEKPEFLCEKLSGKKNDLKNVVIFTDVISTGNTVISIQQKINDCLALRDNINWIAVSIISDVKQPRKVEINNFFALGSLCINLRIPILNVSDLPSLDILPNKYDII